MSFILENIFIIAIAVVAAGMLAWPALSRTRGSSGVDTLVATQMANQQHAVFVDVRSTEEYAQGHIAQARNVPLDQIEGRAASVLPKNKPLIVVCANGRAAGRAAAQLQSKGFQNVVTLNGGMQGWLQAGLPVTNR